MDFDDDDGTLYITAGSLYDNITHIILKSLNQELNNICKYVRFSVTIIIIVIIKHFTELNGDPKQLFALLTKKCLKLELLFNWESNHFHHNFVVLRQFK